MEIDNLQNIWKEFDSKLQDKLKLNDKKWENLHKAKGQLDKVLMVQKMGMYSTIPFASCSFVVASLLIKEPMYFIPGYLGAFLMLYSFFMHQRYAFEILPFANFNSSVKQFQEIVAKTYIWVNKPMISDIFIASFWLFTYIIMICHGVFHNLRLTAVMICAFILILIIRIGSVYKDLNQKLKNAEVYLDEIEKLENVE